MLGGILRRALGGGSGHGCDGAHTRTLSPCQSHLLGRDWLQPTSAMCLVTGHACCPVHVIFLSPFVRVPRTDQLGANTPELNVHMTKPLALRNKHAYPSLPCPAAGISSHSGSVLGHHPRLCAPSGHNQLLSKADLSASATATPSQATFSGASSAASPQGLRVRKYWRKGLL